MTPEVQAFLAALLKEANETPFPGRGQMLAERYNRVKSDGMYYENGCWVRIV